MATQRPVTETLKEVVANDQPLGEQAPGAPFAVVALTYLAVLTIAAFGLGIVLWAVL